MSDYSDTQLVAYLDELLPESTLASLEETLRSDPELKNRLEEMIRRRDAGVHSLGDVWRRQRVTCPSREELGSYLMRILADEEHDYVQFHVDQVGCRYCHANLADLRTASESSLAGEQQIRRRRIFESSAGHLRRRENDDS